MNTKISLAISFFLFVSSFGACEEQFHILQKNETLYGLAKEYNTTVDNLIHINNIKDPRKLYVGMKIYVEGRQEEGLQSEHRVEKGETLFGIAKRYGLTLHQLLTANNLAEGYLLKAGDILSIPGMEEKNPEPEDPITDPDEDPAVEEPKTPAEIVLGKWPLQGSPVPADGKIAGVYISGTEGDNIRSISSGSVVWVGPYRGFGKVILVQSEDRYVYVYGGNSETHVAVGQDVSPGMVISTLGINPHTQAPELFFSVFRNGKPVDPKHAPRS